MNKEGWAQQARCAGRRTELWFAQPRGYDAAQARMVCQLCPVVTQCLAQALAAEGRCAAEMRFGIYGNTTPRQRHVIAQGSVHGTARAPQPCPERCGPCLDYRRGETASQRRPPQPRRTK